MAVAAKRVGLRATGVRCGEPDTAAWAATAGHVSQRDVDAVDYLVRALRDRGLWSLIDWLAPSAGRSQQAGLTVLKRPLHAPPKMTAVGSIVFDPALGWTGDGAAKCLNTGLIPGRTNAGATNSVHLSVYVGSRNHVPNALDIASAGPSDAGLFQNLNPLFPQILTRSLGGQYQLLGASNNANTSTLAPGGTRTQTQDAVTLVSYNGARAVKTGSTAFHAFSTTVPLYLLATGTTSSPSSFSYSTIGSVSFGRWLTAALVAVLDEIWEEFHARLGRPTHGRVAARGRLGAQVSGLVLYGQSLAEGYQAQTPRTGDARGLAHRPHVAFLGCPRLQSGGAEERFELAPAGEGWPTASTQYGETPTGGGLVAYTAAGGRRQFLAAGYPVGGTAYSGLASGTLPFTRTIQAHRAARGAVAPSAYEVPYVTITHGETDDANANTSYGTNFTTWRSDFDTALKAVTGQSGDVRFVYSAPASWTSMVPRTTPCREVLAAYLDAHTADADRFLYAGPRYVLDHYATDGIHLTSKGARHLAEMYLKAIFLYERDGSFAPLYPLSVTRSGADITVVFNKGGLLFDTSYVSDPSGSYASRKFGTAPGSATDTTIVNQLGFEFYDDTGSAPSADISGFNGAGLTVASINAAFGTTNVTGDTLVVNLSGTPSGSNMRLAYARSFTSGAKAGPTTGPRGCLRDNWSDAAFVSQWSNPLQNYCVWFDEAAA